MRELRISFKDVNVSYIMDGRLMKMDNLLFVKQDPPAIPT